MPVYMNLQLTGGAARCVATAPGGLLPHLFTLTAIAAVVFCHLNPTVTRSFPLRNVMLCVARTFLSQPCDVNERQATILLSLRPQNYNELSKGANYREYLPAFYGYLGVCDHMENHYMLKQ